MISQKKHLSANGGSLIWLLSLRRSHATLMRQDVSTFLLLLCYYKVVLFFLSVKRKGGGGARNRQQRNWPCPAICYPSIPIVKMEGRGSSQFQSRKHFAAASFSTFLFFISQFNATLLSWLLLSDGTCKRPPGFLVDCFTGSLLTFVSGTSEATAAWDQDGHEAWENKVVVMPRPLSLLPFLSAFLGYGESF